jgi:CubicO group peptidase (beta-lactamase class C family)
MGGISGHAGLFSTADDIALFMDAILNQTFVLNEQSTKELFVARAYLKNLQEVPLIRAYGWDKPQLGGSAGNDADFEETILHTGFTGCNMWINTKKHLGFVLLSNDVHPSREQKGILSLRGKIANIIYKMEV